MYRYMCSEDTENHFRAPLERNVPFIYKDHYMYKAHQSSNVRENAAVGLMLT